MLGDYNPNESVLYVRWNDVGQPNWCSTQSRVRSQDLDTCLSRARAQFWPQLRWFKERANLYHVIQSRVRKLGPVALTTLQDSTPLMITRTCSWNEQKCHAVWSAEQRIRINGYLRRSCNYGPDGECNFVFLHQKWRKVAEYLQRRQKGNAAQKRGLDGWNESQPETFLWLQLYGPQQSYSRMCCKLRR